MTDSNVTAANYLSKVDLAARALWRIRLLSASSDVNWQRRVLSQSARAMPRSIGVVSVSSVVCAITEDARLREFSRCGAVTIE